MKPKSGVYHKILFEDDIWNKLMQMKLELLQEYDLDVTVTEITNELCKYGFESLSVDELMQELAP